LTVRKRKRVTDRWSGGVVVIWCRGRGGGVTEKQIEKDCVYV